MSFRSFLFSKTFFIQITIAIGVVIVLMMFTMLSMRIYTNHGEAMQVPDLYGMQFDQAEQLLETTNLTYEISDSIYLGAAEPGSVIGQVPQAGHLVKEGRTIFLTICAVAPEQISMPKLTDISFRQAVNILQSAGLNVGLIEYVPSEFSNLVLGQKVNGEEIKPGTVINKGSHVDLMIGKSSDGEKTVVPNLFGETLTEARTEIASLFLNVGAIIYDETVATKEDSLAAKVWQQRPSHSSYDEIELGASIDIWLTMDENKLEKQSAFEMENDSIGGI